MKLFRKNPGLFPILGLCLFSCPIFIWVLLMFCQNPLFGPYRFMLYFHYSSYKLDSENFQPHFYMGFAYVFQKSLFGPYRLCSYFTCLF